MRKEILSMILVMLLAQLTLLSSSAQEITRGANVLATNDKLLAGDIRLSQHTSGNYIFVKRSSPEETEQLTVPENDLVWFNGPKNDYRNSVVALNNGSILCGEVRILPENQIEVSGEFWKPITLPFNIVKHIEFQIPSNTELRSRQSDWLQDLNQADDGSAGRVLLSNNDSLAGQISLSDDQPQLLLRSAGAEYQLPLDQVAAVVMGNVQPTTAADKPVTEFYFHDGCQLRVATIQFEVDRIIATCQDFQLTLEKKSNAEPRHPIESTVCGIRNLRFDGSYLSDSAPASYQHTPLLGLETEYRLNRNVVGSEIRNGDFTVPFGIGTPSRSSLVFRIDNAKDELRFQFGVGLDPSSESIGSVGCKILVLNQQDQWTEAWKSPVLQGREGPVFAEIELGTAKAIALTIDYSGNADILDRANWLMPRLVR